MAAGRIAMVLKFELLAANTICSAPVLVLPE
jgi:hypothetical protein